jgi:hypothetical protein
MSALAMKFRRSRRLQASQLRIGSQDRAAERHAAEPARRRFAALSDAGSTDRQEALWAKFMAERPDMLTDIVTFLQGARLRLAEVPSRHASARSDDA